MKRTARMNLNLKKLFLTLFSLCILTAALAISVSAASLPDTDDLSESWFYVYNSKEGGMDIFMFPKNTTFSNIKVTNKNLKVTYKTEGKGKNRRTYLIFGSKKTFRKATLSFTAKYGKKTRKYTTKVHAMKYKNPWKTLKIGTKDFTSCYNKTDSTQTLKNPISGKLTVKANTGFTVTGMEIFDSNTGKTRKVKNGSVISLKKGECLQVYYYYKTYGFNGGLGVVWVM